MRVMAWSSSNRKARLPDDWEVRRRRVIAAAGEVCEYAGCTRTATDVDHVVPNDDHGFANLQALCGHHHALKSAQEGHARTKELRALTKREPETHPGLVPEGDQRPTARRGW